MANPIDENKVPVRPSEGKTASDVSKVPPSALGKEAYFSSSSGDSGSIPFDVSSLSRKSVGSKLSLDSLKPPVNPFPPDIFSPSPFKNIPEEVPVRPDEYYIPHIPEEITPRTPDRFPFPNALPEKIKKFIESTPPDKLIDILPPSIFRILFPNYIANPQKYYQPKM